MQEILEKLDDIHATIQALDIKPTRSNMERMLKVLYFLEDVYSKIKGMMGDGQKTDA